jgi:predicted phage terminase large subunit-like protein
VAHRRARARQQIKNLIVNIPPRHMKSLLVSVFWPTWTWTFLPYLRFLCASYAEELAVRDAVKSRRIIQSPWYHDRWGHVFCLTGDQNRKQRYENDRAGFRVATSVGGVATGEGGDVIVIDDPHKAKGVESDAQRESVTEWWDKTMSTRVNDPKTSSRVIIMQRLHTEDLVGHIREQMGQGGEQYELLVLPAEYEPTTYVTGLGFRDPRAEHGELIWPERFPRDVMEPLKVMLGPYGVAGQLQQRPAPLAGGIFKRHWWGYWVPQGMLDVLPPERVRMADGSLHTCAMVELPDDLEEQAESWDMSFSETTDGSFVVGQVWGKKGADRFLLDQVRERLEFTEAVEAVRELSDRWPLARGKHVENKANGPAVMSQLKREIAGLIPYDPQGDKKARAVAVTPFVAAGNVWLPHPVVAAWVKDLVKRFANFPNDADDEVDAMSQMLDIWAPDEEDEEPAASSRVVTREQVAGMFE